MKTLIPLLLIFVLGSCAHRGHNGGGQCIVDYKVIYHHKDVPDWQNAPEGFCDEKGDFPMPVGTSLYPLSYKQKGKMIYHNESWFYLIWACYSTCDKLKQK